VEKKGALAKLHTNNGPGFTPRPSGIEKQRRYFTTSSIQASSGLRKIASTLMMGLPMFYGFVVKDQIVRC